MNVLERVQPPWHVSPDQIRSNETKSRGRLKTIFQAALSQETPSWLCGISPSTDDVCSLAVVRLPFQQQHIQGTKYLPNKYDLVRICCIVVSNSIYIL